MSLIFQEKNFNLNWGSNPGSLVLKTSMQTIMPPDSDTRIA